MGGCVDQLNRALHHPSIAGINPAVLRLHIIGVQPAQGHNAQASVRLDLRHHGPQRISMGQHHGPGALAAQIDGNAALAGFHRIVAQAAVLLHHIAGHGPGHTRGAVDGQQPLQLLHHIAEIILHMAPPVFFTSVS